MIRSLNSLMGYSLKTTDGEIGKVRDFLVDDQDWSVRYLVADTGGWLSGRLVIISPSVLGNADWHSQSLSVELTRDQVRRSPPIEEDRPVSRQKEIELAEYYGWPMYWNPAMAGAGVMGGPWLVVPPPQEKEQPEPQVKGDPHLQSAREMVGYHVEAVDGEIGHVDDFIIDDDRWVIQYVVVDTKNWWPGGNVTMLPMWISGVSWELRQVRFDLPRETIRNGPAYDPSAPINEDDQLRFYDYYGRPTRDS